MDVLSHIENEHESFRLLLIEIQACNIERKEQLFKKLYKDLSAHHEAEEGIFFPIIKMNSEEIDKKIIREMIEQHHLIHTQLNVMEQTLVEDKTWDAKFAVLKDILNHHMNQEEIKLLKSAKKTTPKQQLVNLLEEFKAIKAQTKEQIKQNRS